MLDAGCWISEELAESRGGLVDPASRIQHPESGEWSVSRTEFPVPTHETRHHLPAVIEVESARAAFDLHEVGGQPGQLLASEFDLGLACHLQRDSGHRRKRRNPFRKNEGQTQQQPGLAADARLEGRADVRPRRRGFRKSDSQPPTRAGPRPLTPDAQPQRRLEEPAVGSAKNGRQNRRRICGEENKDRVRGGLFESLEEGVGRLVTKMTSLDTVKDPNPSLTLVRPSGGRVHNSTNLSDRNDLFCACWQYCLDIRMDPVSTRSRSRCFPTVRPSFDTSTWRRFRPQRARGRALPVRPTVPTGENDLDSVHEADVRGRAPPTPPTFCGRANPKATRRPALRSSQGLGENSVAS